jgi:hypothetical protein
VRISAISDDSRSVVVSEVSDRRLPLFFPHARTHTPGDNHLHQNPRKAHMREREKKGESRITDFTDHTDQYPAHFMAAAMRSRGASSAFA